VAIRILEYKTSKTGGDFKEGLIKELKTDQHEKKRFIESGQHGMGLSDV